MAETKPPSGCFCVQKYKDCAANRPSTSSERHANCHSTSLRSDRVLTEHQHATWLNVWRRTRILTAVPHSTAVLLIVQHCAAKLTEVHGPTYYFWKMPPSLKEKITEKENTAVLSLCASPQEKSSPGEYIFNPNQKYWIYLLTPSHIFGPNLYSVPIPNNNVPPYHSTWNSLMLGGHHYPNKSEW